MFYIFWMGRASSDLYLSIIIFLQRKNEWSESFTIVTCVAKLFLIEM